MRPSVTGLTCGLTHLETQGNNSSLKTAKTLCERGSFSNLKALAGGVVDSRNAAQEAEAQAGTTLPSPLGPRQAAGLGCGGAPASSTPTALLQPERPDPGEGGQEQTATAFPCALPSLPAGDNRPPTPAGWAVSTSRQGNPPLPAGPK